MGLSPWSHGEKVRGCGIVTLSPPDMCQCLFLAGMWVVRSTMLLQSEQPQPSKALFHPFFNGWHFWTCSCDSESDISYYKEPVVPFGHVRIRIPLR
jgi:hypothetical protein